MKMGSVSHHCDENARRGSAKPLEIIEAPKKLTGYKRLLSRKSLQRGTPGLQELTTRHMGKRAHFMSWSQGLHLAQMSGTKLIQSSDAEKSHGCNDFSL